MTICYHIREAPKWERKKIDRWVIYIYVWVIRFYLLSCNGMSGGDISNTRPQGQILSPSQRFEICSRLTSYLFFTWAWLPLKHTHTHSHTLKYKHRHSYFMEQNSLFWKYIKKKNINLSIYWLNSRLTNYQ